MNFNQANMLSHEAINNIQKLSHEIIDTTFNNAIPIINNLANTNINSDNIPCNLLDYSLKEYNDSIYILVYVPGISKEHCNINFTENILNIVATSNFSENDDTKWRFITDKKYMRSLKLNNIIKDNINVKYENGTLQIIIQKYVNSESNINID